MVYVYTARADISGERGLKQCHIELYKGGFFMITVGYKVDMGRAGNPADERGRRGGERGDGVALSVELGDGGFELGHRDVRMRAAQRNTTQHQTPVVRIEAARLWYTRGLYGGTLVMRRLRQTSEGGFNCGVSGRTPIVYRVLYEQTVAR